jgi:hypothetical protein
MKLLTVAVAWLSLVVPMLAQHARVRDAPQIDMPGQVDSNSPAYWKNGSFHLLNSTGNGPVHFSGVDQYQLGTTQGVRINRMNPWPVWMESVWVDPTGAILGWYHQEHFGVCPGSNLSVPQIGAAISYDGGNTYVDFGAIISSGYPVNCAAQNGYFAGGQGDVSVILDRQHHYFYFFFGNYAGPLESQGVAVARMPFWSRFSPRGAVMKYFAGAWTEPGVGGQVTPIFPAKASWMDANTDAFWGPAIHWNTYLNSFVMLLNRSCCSPGFPQAAIYASYSGNLEDPGSWTQPKRILRDTGWYPQVLGLEPGGTDRSAGRVARLYIYGHSRWEITFEKAEPPPPQPPPPEQ